MKKHIIVTIEITVQRKAILMPNNCEHMRMETGKKYMAGLKLAPESERPHNPIAPQTRTKLKNVEYFFDLRNRR